jgi:hypothetical protein
MSFGTPPEYSFTYTALSNAMNNVNVFNGDAAYISGSTNLVQGTTETSSDVVNAERDNIMTNYVVNTVGPYLQPFTVITIGSTMNISPISSGNYYQFGGVSSPITLTFTGSQTDVFYIYKGTTESATLNLSLVTFGLNGANVANIYIIYNQSLILPSTMYGNLILLGGNFTINNDATLYGTASVNGNMLFESTGTLTVQSPTPIYPFTYSAIASTLNNINVVGGEVGYLTLVPPVTSTPNSPTTNIGNEPLFLTSFTNFITGVYLPGLVAESITSDITLSPGVCYTLLTPSVTITIPLTSADNLFFIYSISAIDLSAVTFIMNGNTAANVYIISDGDVTAAPLMFGNIICPNLIVPSETTLYGSASSQGTLGSGAYRLNIIFQYVKYIIEILIFL